MSGAGWNGERRSALGVVGDTFRLYVSHPLLFFVLAAGVLVPYEAILVAATGSGPSAQPGGVSLLLSVLDLGFVTPLISALHVHAVADGKGNNLELRRWPSAGSMFCRSWPLPRLPPCWE